MSIGGIGITEVLVIMIVAVILLGPTKAADMAKSTGRMLREMRRSFTDLSANLEDDSLPGTSAWPPSPDSPNPDGEGKTPN